jgi:DNA-binding beta-propeller fold protein YncE
MKLAASFLCAVFSIAVLDPVSAAAQQWHLTKTVDLGSPGRWDFVHLDPSGQRVYVAHGDKVSIVDVRTGTLVGAVGPIDGAHDAVVVPQLGRLYVDNGTTGKVSIFDSKTLKRLGEIPAKPDTDAMAYDEDTGILIVSDGDSGFATLIDPRTNDVLTTVKIGPGAEGIATDGEGHAFINISDAREMVRVSVKRGVVDRHWPLKECESPHGLAIDRAAGRLFVSCHNDLMLVVKESDGGIVARIAIGHGSDGAAFDPARKLAFSSNKDGTVSVVAELGHDRYKPLAPIETQPGAATMAEDPRTGRIYVVAAVADGQGASDGNNQAERKHIHDGAAQLLIFAPVEK